MICPICKGEKVMETVSVSVLFTTPEEELNDIVRAVEEGSYAKSDGLMCVDCGSVYNRELAESLSNNPNNDLE